MNKYDKYINDVINTKLYKDFPRKFKQNGEYQNVVISAKDREERVAWINEKKENKNQKHSDFLRENLEIKYTICKNCFKKHSIYYEYPTKNLLKKIKNLSKNKSIIHQYNDYKKEIDSILKTNSIEELIKKTKNPNYYLSPGAMSNFPDRSTGFHDFNVCCRQRKDKGRDPDAMKKYNKDRRIFEILSDGNIRAADKYMKSPRFKNLSADHIGPVSLGFIHDPINLKPMKRSENSSKNNRLNQDDIKTLIKLSNTKQIISDFAKHIWDEFIENPYDLALLRNKLLNNSFRYRNLMVYLKSININEFNKVLNKKMWSYNYDFILDNEGKIISQKKRRKTKSSNNELSRVSRIFSDSNKESKNNRKIKAKINEKEKKILQKTPTYDELLKLLKK